MRGFLIIKANVPEKAGNIDLSGQICLIINSWACESSLSRATGKLSHQTLEY